jgi:hypothetical protein
MDDALSLSLSLSLTIITRIIRIVYDLNLRAGL